MAKKKPEDARVIHDGCHNCRHWGRFDDARQAPSDDVQGECRRYPATVFGIEEVSGEPIQALPEHGARFCCGEHHRSIT